MWKSGTLNAQICICLTISGQYVNIPNRVEHIQRQCFIKLPVITILSIPELDQNGFHIVKHVSIETNDNKIYKKEIFFYFPKVMKLKCCRKKRITQRFVNKCGLIHKCRQINNTEKSETSKRHLVEFKFYIVAIESSLFWFETNLGFFHFT